MNEDEMIDTLEIDAELLEDGSAPTMSEDGRRIGRHILRAILSQHWAMTPESLELMLEIVLRRNESVDAIAVEIGEPLDNTRTVTTREGIATIPVAGPLFRKANLLTEVSGASSYETIARDLRAALANENVRGILLDIDSPGGECQGTSDLAEMIYAARGEKPIWAYAGGFAASAAYWIASAADLIYSADTGVVGSIGVVAAFTDTKDADAARGIRRVSIVSSQSPMKNADPTQGKGKKAMQQTVDDLAEVFVAAVERNRGVSRETVLEKFGAGGVLVGKRAQKAGMVDGVRMFEEAHAELVEFCETKQQGRRASASHVAELAASADVCTSSEDTPVNLFCEMLRKDDAQEASRIINEAAEALAAELVAQARANPQATIEGADRGESPTSSASDKGPATEPDTIKGVSAMEPDGTATAAAPNIEAGTSRDDTVAMLKLAAEHPERISIMEVSAMIEEGKTLSDLQTKILVGYQNGEKDVAYSTPASDSGKITRVRDKELDKPFESIGEQLILVAKAEISGMKDVDGRLLELNAAATGMSEGVGPEGGFAVEKMSSDKITSKVHDTGELLSRITPTPIGPGKNGLKKRYIKETSRADGSRAGGVRAYWANEAATVTASEATLGLQELELNKVMAILYATEELLEDSTALSALVYREVPKELVFKVEDSLINGTGAGQCLGVLNSPCLVSVAKEDGQDAATLYSENLVKMYARAWARGRKNSVWLINQDVEPELFTTGILVGTGGQAVYMPPGGLSQSPYGTILGLPVVAVEYCQTVGTVGDIILFSPDEYELIEKGGIKASTSVHVKFLYDEMTFKFTYRTDGQPNWDSALTPKNGTNTLSPFVALATRA